MDLTNIHERDFGNESQLYAKNKLQIELARKLGRPIEQGLWTSNDSDEFEKIFDENFGGIMDLFIEDENKAIDFVIQKLNERRKAEGEKEKIN